MPAAVPLPEQTLETGARERRHPARRGGGGRGGTGLHARFGRSEDCSPCAPSLACSANLRPAIAYPELADASTLKPDVVRGLDVLIVREADLVASISGGPRGIRAREDGRREGFNTLVYAEGRDRAGVPGGVRLRARRRAGRVCSVDKANVLEASELWREVATKVAEEYDDVELSHMYVDNAAMQLVRAPKQFDVIVTSNMFGDILSDLASMLTGSIGMLPSASLDASGKGLYEPIHGAAPDIAGKRGREPSPPPSSRPR